MNKEHKFRLRINNKFFYYTIEELMTTNFNGFVQLITKDQYTGLKDMNGKEIYEGDIVKHPYKFFLTFPTKPVQGIIKYVVSSFVLECPGHSLEEVREFEVIGNIYENPELLKDNK